MKRFLHIIGLVIALASPAALASAQELQTDSFADEFVLENFLNEQVEVSSFIEEVGCETGCSETISETRESQQTAGPGFRPFVRMSVLGAFVADVPAEWAVSDFSAFGQDYSLQRSRDFLGKRQQIESLELMAQHLWDGNGKIKNRRPTLRAGIQAYGFGLEMGQLPLPEVSTGESAGKPVTQDRVGFNSANYFGYGVRVHRGLDTFYWGGSIDGMNGWGRTWVDTWADHTVVGPQLTLGRVISRGRWLFELSAHGMLGYQKLKANQFGGFGQNIITGGLNNVAVARPNYSSASRKDEDFAQHGELRLTSSYFVTSRWTFDASLKAFIAGPWHRAARLVVYRLPNFGIRPGVEPSYHSGVNLFFGMTYLH